MSEATEPASCFLLAASCDLGCVRNLAPFSVHWAAWKGGLKIFGGGPDFP